MQPIGEIWRETRDCHKGQACLVLGNGKSLAAESNETLCKLPSFGTNRIYLRQGFEPTYYVCVNELVAGQYKQDIENIGSIKFVTDRVPMKGVIPLRSNHIMAFSKDPSKYICEGYTVTYVCLQLAYHMGFKTVYLLGVDHSYKFDGEPNGILLAHGEDPNHFDPHYFSDGKIWNAPDLENSERAYRIARRVYEEDGREIINLTPDSKLDVFLRSKRPW